MICVLREIIFAGGKYLVIKTSLHLSQESILLRGKDENQLLARSRSENDFFWQYHYTHIFYFALSHNSTKVIRWDATSSLGLPKNCSFITRFSKATLLSQDSALATGGEIGVLIKSLLLVLEKSHNLVFSRDIVTKQAI